MILPVAHEHATVRKLPWVTFTVIALCILTHLEVMSQRDAMTESEQAFEEALDYFADRPYLDPDPRLLPPAIKELYDRELLERAASTQPEGAQQSRLDALTDNWLATLAFHPLWREGLVPADFSWPSLITHFFLHAGWMHLFGNLLFLYLTGPYVEDAWGRLLYGGFYLVAGVVAGGGFLLRYPDLYRPLVGASGAIAGVMGAFLVLHLRTRIRFVYWFGILVGTFRAPALVMLPLWFLGELGSAVTMDRAMPGGVAGGVAYWAHVFGFLFGVAVALGLKRLSLERERTDTEIEEIGSDPVDRVLERALSAQRHGRRDQAVQILRDAVQRGSASIDVHGMYWEMAVEDGAGPRLGGVAQRLIRDEITHHRLDDALRHYRQLEHVSPGTTDQLIAGKLAESLFQSDRTEAGREVLTRTARRLNRETPAGPLALLLRLAAAHDRELHRTLVPGALENPYLPADLREELELGHLSQ